MSDVTDSHGPMSDVTVSRGAQLRRRRPGPASCATPFDGTDRNAKEGEKVWSPREFVCCGAVCGQIARTFVLATVHRAAQFGSVLPLRHNRAKCAISIEFARIGLLILYECENVLKN
jgi:hypothetical protein